MAWFWFPIFGPYSMFYSVVYSSILVLYIDLWTSDAGPIYKRARWYVKAWTSDGQQQSSPLQGMVPARAGQSRSEWHGRWACSRPRAHTTIAATTAVHRKKPVQIERFCCSMVWSELRVYEQRWQCSVQVTEWQSVQTVQATRPCRRMPRQQGSERKDSER